MLKQLLIDMVRAIGGIEDNDVSATCIRGHVGSVQVRGGDHGKQTVVQFNLLKNTPVAGSEPAQTTHRCKLFGDAATEHISTLKVGAYVSFMGNYRQSRMTSEEGDRWFHEFHANDPDALVIHHYSRRTPRPQPQPRTQPQSEPESTSLEIWDDDTPPF
jgi:hypothetical protein